MCQYLSLVLLVNCFPIIDRTILLRTIFLLGENLLLNLCATELVIASRSSSHGNEPTHVSTRYISSTASRFDANSLPDRAVLQFSTFNHQLHSRFNPSGLSKSCRSPGFLEYDDIRREDSRTPTDSRAENRFPQPENSVITPTDRQRWDRSGIDRMDGLDQISSCAFFHWLWKRLSSLRSTVQCHRASIANFRNHLLNRFQHWWTRPNDSTQFSSFSEEVSRSMPVLSFAKREHDCSI